MTSEHSRFFGIRLEILGLMYYALIGVFYIFFLLFPSLLTTFISSSVFFLSFGAFLFSLYLTFLQFFVLRELCTWCLMSASFSTFLFIFSAARIYQPLLSILEKYHQGFLIAHVFAVVLGFGAVLVAEIFFKNFLRDGDISSFESSAFTTISQVIWFACGLLLLSGVGLVLPAWREFFDTPKFLLKMIVVGVIFINGGLLHVFCLPYLHLLSFSHPSPARFRRRLFFIFGAISFVSWSSAFLLGMISSFSLGFSALLFLYVFSLFCAGAGGFFYEALLTHRYSPRTSQ